MEGILKHTPPLADHNWLDRSALTVEWMGKTICRLDYPYDQLPPLPGSAQDKLSPEHMNKAYDTAWMAYVVRQVALGTIFTGYDLHLLEIDLPFIGGELGAGKWGVLAGLCLQLGLIIPVSALIHTIARGHPFIGPSGLFTRGLVSADFSIRVMEFCVNLTGSHLEKDLDERKKFDVEYEKIYQKEAKTLEKELQKIIKGTDSENLKIRARQLQQKEGVLGKIFGFNTLLFRLHLRALYLRIQNFDISTVDEKTKEEMNKIKTRFVTAQDQTTADMIPYDFDQQEFVLKKKTNVQPSEPSAEQKRLQSVQTSLKEKKRIGDELDDLSLRLSQSSTSQCLQERKEGENLLGRAKTAESDFLAVTSPSSELTQLYQDHQAKKKYYQKLKPSANRVMRAYTTATFYSDKAIWATGEEKDKKNASELGKERLKNYLTELEKGLCDPDKFIQWVEERLFPEIYDPYVEINSEAHKHWDHFRAVTKSF